MVAGLHEDVVKTLRKFTSYDSATNEVVYVVDDGRGAYACKLGAMLAVYGDVKADSVITAVIGADGQIYDGCAHPLLPQRVTELINNLPPANRAAFLELRQLKRALSALPEYIYLHIFPDRAILGANGRVLTVDVEHADGTIYGRFGNEPFLKTVAGVCTERVLMFETADTGRPTDILIARPQPWLRVYIKAAIYLYDQALGGVQGEDCVRLVGVDKTTWKCIDSRGDEVEIYVDLETRYAILQKAPEAYYTLTPIKLRKGPIIFPGSWWRPDAVTVVYTVDGKEYNIAVDLDTLYELF